MSNDSWNSAVRDTGNTTASGTVAGYFASGDDAHRAINELLEEGFSSREIGAAFHGDSALRSSSAQASAQAVSDIPTRSASAADATPAGAASGTNAVSPWGLSTGGGTVIAGASAPGPIPGGEIPSGLPSNIPSELASDTGNRTSRTYSPESAQQTAGGNVPATGGFHETHDETRKHESWWSKLKHVFGSEHTNAAAKREPVSDKSSLNFGTGEGHLGTYADHDYAYSGAAFESSFSGMGIPQEHAQRLSRELGRGGAVVTVRAGSRNVAAEAVMERNHGTIRYESQSAAGESAWNSGNQEERVEIFGEVYRVYPAYIPADDVRDRKAS